MSKKTIRNTMTRITGYFNPDILVAILKTEEFGGKLWLRETRMSLMADSKFVN